jgi:hypothetical protein
MVLTFVHLIVPIFVQDKEAFLKAHPDYKWYSHDKQESAVAKEQLSHSASTSQSHLTASEVATEKAAG